jgi:hypothetical protein
MASLKVFTVASALLLMVPPAMALETAPLAPGKPSGVEQAQRRTRQIFMIGGALLVTVVAIGVAMATSNDKACGAACNVTSATTS